MAFEARRIGRQWQIWKAGEFYCLATAHTGRRAVNKDEAEHHAYRLTMGAQEAEAFDREQRARRLERVAAYLKEREARKADLAKQRELI